VTDAPTMDRHDTGELRMTKEPKPQPDTEAPRRLRPLDDGDLPEDATLEEILQRIQLIISDEGTKH
jgi:hypothetical protein